MPNIYLIALVAGIVLLCGSLLLDSPRRSPGLARVLVSFWLPAFGLFGVVARFGALLTEPLRFGVAAGLALLTSAAVSYWVQAG